MVQFSVVIPLYNKEKHIRRSIDSVLNQTYQNFEIIIIDDGSTDNGADIVRAYTDERIRFITQKNCGVSIARNNGIKEAKYEFVAFLDADDAWKKDFLESGINLIKKFPKAGAYSFAYEIYASQNDVKNAEYFNIPKTSWEGLLEDFFEMMLTTSPVWSSSVIIPKHVFDGIGVFKEGETIGEDVELWCRVALNYRIAFSNAVKATYFLDAENRAYVVGKKVKRPQGYINTLEDALKNKALSDKEKNDINNLLNTIIIGQGTFQYFFGDAKEARNSFSKITAKKYKVKKIFLVLITFIPLPLTRVLIKLRNTMRR